MTCVSQKVILNKKKKRRRRRRHNLHEWWFNFGTHRLRKHRTIAQWNLPGREQWSRNRADKIISFYWQNSPQKINQETIKSPILWLKSVLLQSLSEAQRCSVSEPFTPPSLPLSPAVEHSCAINALQLNLWWPEKRKLPFFPFSLPTITLALHSWFDFNTALFGLCHRTAEEHADGKSHFWGFESTFCPLIAFPYLGSESHVLVFSFLWKSTVFPLSSSPHPSFYLLRLEWGFTEPPPPLPAPTTTAAAAAVLLNVLRHGQQETRPRKTTSVIHRSGQAAGIRAAAGLARGTFPLVNKSPWMDAVCFFTST